MQPAGNAAERKAPAALGARLSEAIFFLDAKLAAELLSVRWGINIHAQHCAILCSDEGLTPRIADLRNDTFDDLQRDVLSLGIKAYGLLLKNLIAGKLIGNGIAAGGRYDVLPSAWEIPFQSPASIDGFLNCRATVASGQSLTHIRVRPRFKVPRETAARATGDRLAVAQYLARSSEKALHEKMQQPLWQALEAGLVMELPDRCVLFKENFDETAAMDVRVVNWPNEGLKNKGGRPRSYDWDRPISLATARFALEPDLSRRSLAAEIANFLAGQLADEAGGPGPSELSEKAKIVVASLRDARSSGNR